MPEHSTACPQAQEVPAWVIPHVTRHPGTALPLVAGAVTLALAVALTGVFPGRDVVPLSPVSVR